MGTVTSEAHTDTWAVVDSNQLLLKELESLLNMTSTIGIPIKLLNEATGHQVTVEIDSGQTYRGKLVEAEDNMNCQLENINVTQRDGRVTHLDRVYIRGSHVRLFVVPDMLRNAPMFRSRGTRGRGVGLARGRATVNRARGQRGEIDECGLERE